MNIKHIPHPFSLFILFVNYIYQSNCTFTRINESDHHGTKFRDLGSNNKSSNGRKKHFTDKKPHTMSDHWPCSMREVCLTKQQTLEKGLYSTVEYKFQITVFFIFRVLLPYRLIASKQLQLLPVNWLFHSV